MRYKKKKHIRINFHTKNRISRENERQESHAVHAMEFCLTDICMWFGRKINEQTGCYLELITLTSTIIWFCKWENWVTEREIYSRLYNSYLSVELRATCIQGLHFINMAPTQVLRGQMPIYLWENLNLTSNVLSYCGKKNM